MKIARPHAFTDEILAQFCSLVEQLILSADETAAANGIKLTDSGVKSALVKAVNILRGRPPKNVGNSPKDQFLTKLTGVVIGLGQQVAIVEEGQEDSGQRIPLTIVQWIHTLTAIIQSIESRMSGQPGGRDYLEFIPDFLRSVPKSVSFPGAPGTEVEEEGDEAILHP